MKDTTLIKRINNMEALAKRLLDEATELKKMAGPVEARPSRKGAINQEQIAQVIEKRRRRLNMHD